MKSIYSQNQRNFNQVPVVTQDWIANPVKHAFCPFHRQNSYVMTNSEVFNNQVVNHDAYGVQKFNSCTAIDMVSEGTHDSPKTMTGSKINLMQGLNICTPLANIDCSEYCTCGIYNICTVSDETDAHSMNSNDLSNELNKLTKVYQDEDGDFEAINAHFLFPKENSPRVMTKKVSLSSNISQ